MNSRLHFRSILKTTLGPVAVAMGILMLSMSSVFGQWKTEEFTLSSGWHAIYISVDPGLQSVTTLLEEYPQIEELWRWNIEATDPKLVNEDVDLVVGVEWQLWKRDDLGISNLGFIYPNSGYMIKVSDDITEDVTLSIKGAVTAPQIKWRTDGLNLLGFPVNPEEPQKIEPFFAPSRLVGETTEIYTYLGGPLSKGPEPGVPAPPPNPAKLSSQGNIERGKAYWIRAEKYADYDGPLRVRAALGQGIDFQEDRSTIRLILTNRADHDLNATLTPIASESDPEDQTNSTPQQVPLTIRKEQDNGEIAFESFGESQEVSLRAGETIGITLGIDRALLTGDPGDQAFSLLQVNDSDGLSEFYIPARAEVGSLAGLWLGEAQITHVQNQLQRFEKGEDGTYLVDENGQYTLIDEDQDMNKTAQTFDLRLIVHVDDSGNARLLSKVYQGAIGQDVDQNPTIGLVLEEERLLPEFLEFAARFLAVHLPLGTNLPFSNVFSPGAQLSGDLVIGHSAPENPFIHTYHPDHDNLDARFESALPEGVESHRIDRSITLTFDGEPGEIIDPSWGNTLLTGTYTETVQGLHKNDIGVQGVFALRKVSDISEITP